MKMKQIIFLVFIYCTFVACEDDHNEKETNVEIPDLPELSYLKLEELITGDATPVEKRDEYFFTNKKLAKHLTTQQFGQDPIYNEVNLSYAGNRVTIADDAGNSSVYTLNEGGRATQCVRTEVGGTIRNYTFGYSDDGNYLIALKEEINGKTYSEVSIDKETSGSSIMSVNIDGFQNQYRLTPGSVTNNAQIPELHLTEVYPLSLHADAMYAHILGQNPSLLIDRISPVGEDETTYYVYTTENDGCLVSCEETIISQRVTYPSRTIKYQIIH